MATKDKIMIWTDGSCSNNHKDKNHGLGGWAFVAYRQGVLIEEDLGFYEETNSVRMEMAAAIHALKFTKKNFKGLTVHIHSDNAMVVDCFVQEWYVDWELSNFYNKKNPELWKEMLKLFKENGNTVKFVKVKGHSGIPENERVDFLAGEARKYLIEQRFPEKSL